MADYATLENAVVQLRGMFPQMTQERATDLLVRHNLNVNLAIEEQLNAPTKDPPPITITATPPSGTSAVNDFDILWDPIPTKPTVARANSTPNYNKPNAPSTLNDLSDIFGSIPVASAPAPHKKDGRSKSLSSATSPFADFEFGDDSSKKSKKDKKDKRLSLGAEAPKDIMSSFDEDDSKKLDRKKSERQLKKEEKEKKKLEEEKKKQEEKEKKRLEKEKKKIEEEKKKEEKKRQSLKPHEIAEAMSSHSNDISGGSGASSTTEENLEEEELSKHDESVMQWIPKLKKAHKSCLLTINNSTGLYLELVKCHEDKGKWRRKPAEMIHPKSSTQFGVESKNILNGYAHYSVEGYNSNIEFTWSFEKDKPVIVLNVPNVFKYVETSSHDRSNDKFADIVYDLKEVSPPPPSDSNGTATTNGESVLGGSGGLVGSSNTTMTSSGEGVLSASSASNSSILSDLVSSNKFKMEDSSETSSSKGGESNANSDSDSSDDEEEEIRKQKTLFRNISFKPKEQVEEVDSATLQNAALSLKMPTLGGLSSSGAGGTVGRRGRNTLTSKPSLVNSSPSSVSTSSITTVQVHQQQQQQEQADKIYSKSMGSLPSASVTSKERMDPVVIDENAKTLIRSAFTNLERGDFKEALSNVNEILRIVILLEDPLVKQKEAKISSIYKLALKLLLVKSSLEEPSNSNKIATLTIFLSELPLQPKHRVICIRMAVKANLHIKNYGIAARLLQMILPLNLADRSMQESQLSTCKENNLHDNAFSLPSPAFCCYETLELISTPTCYICEYCDAKFSMSIGQELRKCAYCNYGNLHVLPTKR